MYNNYINYMSNIQASYVPNPNGGTGSIVVKKAGTANRVVPTSDLLDIDFNNITATSFSNNRNDSNFTEEQKRLRILDMMKDGKVSKGSNISGSVNAIMNLISPPYDAYTRLGEIEHKFDIIMDPKMKPWSWPKISKASALNPLLPRKVVFKESGLDAEYFVDSPIFCGNFANEVVDPAGRSPIQLAKDIIFPKVGETLLLDESFLTFFGFPVGCSVQATRQTTGKYAFVINLPGLAPITTNPMGGVDWFQGNVQKNNFIANGGPNAKTAAKRGLLITKEMGDVLQVLIMFLWKLFNIPGPLNYTMVTCDKVVMLQCILLNLNCVLTAATKDNGVKLRQIHEYRPITDPRARALENFDNEKRKILEQNAKFISGFTALKARPNTNIYMAGDSPRTFSSEFYEIIERELSTINQILTVLQPSATDTPVSIDALTEGMKKSFLFNLFIRKPANQLKMMLAKKYTEQDTLWVNNAAWAGGNFQSALPNYGRDPFYSIGKIPRFLTSRGGGGLVQKGGGDDLDSTQEKVFEFLEYDFGPALYFDPNDGDRFQQIIPPQVSEDSIDAQFNFITDPVDLYETLNGQIMHFLQGMFPEEDQNMYYFYEFANELYFKFYLNNMVVYDEQLHDLINYIKENDIVIPGPGPAPAQDVVPQLGSEINPNGPIEPQVDYQPTVENSNNFVRVEPTRRQIESRQIEPAFKRGRNLSDELSGENEEENQQNLSAKKRAISVGGKKRTIKRKRKQKKTKGRKQNKKSKRGKRSSKKTRKYRK